MNSYYVKKKNPHVETVVEDGLSEHKDETGDCE
jgi:hypothetical protein